MMKRMFSLTLCLLMLLTAMAGCGEPAPDRLDDARISADLVRNSHLYSYTHVGGSPTLSRVTVDTSEEGDNASVSATATATYTNATVDIAAAMTYARIGTHWKLESVEITSKTITLTGGPDHAGVMAELTNYVTIAGSAYSVMGETYQPLYFDITAVKTAMQYENGAKTATLTMSYTSDKLTFDGSYTLTFDEAQGWKIETIKQADNRYHPLMRLTKLEQEK